MAPKAKEMHSADVKIEQPDDLVLPDIDLAINFDKEIIQPNEEELNKQYLDALAFNEEPIAFQIEPSSEENPPMYIDCWVQGKGCEIFQDGKWMVVGAFQVGVELITRRKYIEVLAMAKKMTVRTLVVDPNADKPENRIVRSTSQRAAFTILQDRNPKGRAWLRSVVGSR